jgi:GNAT superfamily N-acetyltransferase
MDWVPICTYSAIHCGEAGNQEKGGQYFQHFVLLPSRDTLGLVVTHFRRALRADTERIALLHADSWRRTYRGSYRDEFLDGEAVRNRLEVWRSRLADDREDQFVYLAEADSRLLGFVCVFGNTDATWGSLIDNLHVSYESQRSGIGTSLMGGAAAWLESHHGQTGVYLWALEENLQARAFYERLGAVHAEMQQVENPGGGSSPSWRLAWARPKDLRLRAEELTNRTDSRQPE